MTFAPSCVIDEFYSLFEFILDCQKPPSIKQCFAFLESHEYKYIKLNYQALEVLEVKTAEKRREIRELIDRELEKLLEIVTYTLWAIKGNQK